LPAADGGRLRSWRKHGRWRRQNDGRLKRRDAPAAPPLTRRCAARWRRLTRAFSLPAAMATAGQLGSRWQWLAAGRRADAYHRGGTFEQ